MLEKLRKYYLIYRNKCGRKHLFMVKEEEFLYMMSRSGLKNVNKNILRGNVNIFKINDAVQELLVMGSPEDFQPMDSSVKLPQPEGVRICLEMMRNTKCIQ